MNDIKTRAEQGQVSAQIKMGLWYLDGSNGVAEDSVEAAKWFRKAAEQGHALAQSMLGAMYYAGLGVTKDHAEMVKWVSKAAEQGDAEGQFRLGHYYCKGLGVGEDHAEAVKWFRNSAEQGHVAAQYNLGNMYDTGDGVAQDAVMAYMWLNLADAGYTEIAKDKKANVSEKMTDEQIAEAQKLSREQSALIWKRVAGS